MQNIRIYLSIIFLFFLILTRVRGSVLIAKSSNSKFPIYSTVALLYPITAGIHAYSYGAPIVFAFYYGLSNLGYLLIAAGIFKGSFLILGLETRAKVLIWGVIALAVGALYLNII